MAVRIISILVDAVVKWIKVFLLAEEVLQGVAAGIDLFDSSYVRNLNSSFSFPPTAFS